MKEYKAGVDFFRGKDSDCSRAWNYFGEWIATSNHWIDLKSELNKKHHIFHAGCVDIFSENFNRSRSHDNWIPQRVLWGRCNRCKKKIPKQIIILAKLMRLS